MGCGVKATRENGCSVVCPWLKEQGEGDDSVLGKLQVQNRVYLQNRKRLETVCPTLSISERRRCWLTTSWMSHFHPYQIKLRSRNWLFCRNSCSHFKNNVAFCQEQSPKREILKEICISRNVKVCHVRQIAQLCTCLSGTGTWVQIPSTHTKTHNHTPIRGGDIRILELAG